MKYGVRECADVVFRSKSTQKIGNKIFYQMEPVIYFDTLKTSSLEGAATTVYAQGGRGNPRLMSWDGERTVTFTMEDALISPVGLAILSGAGLIDATGEHKVIQHITERTDRVDYTAAGDNTPEKLEIKVAKAPYVADSGKEQDTIYAMKLNSNGEVDSEPILMKVKSNQPGTDGLYTLELAEASGYSGDTYYLNPVGGTATALTFKDGETMLVDYYTAHSSDAYEINITPDRFGGAFYMEASTLWRDQGTQKDYPAEFIIPNLRVQSNFTFTMASSGDPSSFTFTCDAFPDYTRFDKTKKVLAQIQIIGAGSEAEDTYRRVDTKSQDTIDDQGVVTAKPTIITTGDNAGHRTGRV